MNTIKFLTTGLAGSTALTALHQSLRKTKGAPRVDLLGQQAIEKAIGGKSNFNSKQTYYGALAGDIITNSMYYSVIAKAKKPVLTGAIMGATAGLMAIYAPDLLNLNKDYVKSTDKKKNMTIGYYTFAGVVAGLAAKWMKK